LHTFLKYSCDQGKIIASSKTFDFHCQKCFKKVNLNVWQPAMTCFKIRCTSIFRSHHLTRIPIPSRVYLIDTGNKERARDSRRPPPPIHQAIYFSLVGATSLGSVSQPRVAGGDGPGGGWGARRGGRRERRKRASHPVNRAYTHNILKFSYFLLGNEPIRGSHFSSFLNILL
jgi:hypothetical protein